MNDLTLKDGRSPADYGCGMNISAANVVNLNRCTFTGNQAQVFGGALYVQGAQVNVTNCTIAGNLAYNQGGGIYLSSGSLKLTHTTITDNTSNGGGMYIYGASPLLVNTIVAGNHRFGSAPQIGGNIVDTNSHQNLVDDASSAGGMTNNIVGVNPRLTGLASNGGPTQTAAISPGSPACNTAAAGAASIDQRGIPRPQGPAADIGAFE